jgi:hypothetical protein
MTIGPVDPATAALAMPLTIPPGWRVAQRAADGMLYVNPGGRMSVILSVSSEADGRMWLHASMAHRDRLPTWGELTAMKAWAIGDRYAYQVLPPKALYVNINPNVLHLWCPLEGDPPLPDFTQGQGTI